MNNEEKILQLLEQMDVRLAGLEKGQAIIQEDVSGLKEDVSELKEEAKVTRHSVNLLLKWAEKAERAVNVGLYDK